MSQTHANAPAAVALGLNDIMELILANEHLHDRIALVHTVNGMKRPTALAVHFARAVEDHVRVKVWEELVAFRDG